MAPSRVPAPRTGSWNTGPLGGSTRASATMKPDAPREMAGAEIGLGGKDTTPARGLSFPPAATTQGSERLKSGRCVVRMYWALVRPGQPEWAYMGQVQA